MGGRGGSKPEDENQGIESNLPKHDPWQKSEYGLWTGGKKEVEEGEEGDNGLDPCCQLQ